MTEVERLARLICEQQNPDLDPETICHAGEPRRVSGGYVHTNDGVPLWQMYTLVAVSILNSYAPRKDAK